MFEKNLEALDNIVLKKRLMKITTTESCAGISYCMSASNDYVLLKDDVPIDDLTNPRMAIQQMIGNTIKSDMSPNDIIAEFGIGLGYLLDETFNKFNSKIYIYEPDIYLLHFVLSNVDISDHLASGRVYITNDMTEFMNKLSSTFLTKDRVEILYLQNYAIVKNKEILLFTQKVFDTCKSKMVDINTIFKYSAKWLENALNNIAYAKEHNTYLLSDLEGKFAGQTALIAGAGPSLKDNLQKIQENRDKFVIFAVNKVTKYLLQNGITPDFVVSLDADFIDKTFEGCEDRLSRSCCIMDISTDCSVTKLNFNKIFFNFTESDFLIKKLTQYSNPVKIYETGGSAATLALISAIKMGFLKIVMAGVDLAFKDNLVYADGQVMNRLSQETILADGVKKNLVQVKSVAGNTIYTREDYATFIQHFETIIKNLNYSEIYNISSFGANIPETKNTTFDELTLFVTASTHPITDVHPFKFNIKEFIDEEFFNINNIISILSKGTFSPELVSAIVKSSLIYQYMQPDIVTVLQKNFEPELAEEFISKTKTGIKTVVEILQKNKLI